MTMTMELRGKVAFITGSANGIGKGYAEALLRKGSKVFLGDIDEVNGEATLKELGIKYGTRNICFLKLDVTNEEQFKEVFNAAISAFGQVDIMVNNAGVFDESKWKTMINVNLLGVVLGTKIAEEHMRKDNGGKGGRIVNISSLLGFGDHCQMSVYCATKHAVRSYTMSQASKPDREDQGIEYATLCPGPVDTELIRQADDSKVMYYDTIKDVIRDTLMPISHTVDAFMEVIQLQEMNGAMLKITIEGNSYYKMEGIDLGETFVSSIVSS